MPTKAELEKRKLEAEIRKVEAEAEAAELDLAQWKREEAKARSAEHQNRIYNFIGPVGGQSVKECITTLGRWSRRDPGEPITIVFHSPGGSVLDGLALYDSLEELRAAGHHLTTIVRGMAASMGGVLLQAGDDRVIGPNSYFMAHEVSASAVGKVSEQEDDLQFTKRLQDRLAEILVAKSNWTKEQLKRKWRKSDIWLSADECVEAGFADRVG